MRALTVKEKRLLAGLLGAIFVLFNVVGLQAFLNRQRTLQSSIVRLQGELTEGRAILEEKTVWQERAAWLDAKQPGDDTTTTDDDAKFYEFVENSAKNAGLTYTRRDAGQRQSDGAYAEVVDSSQVKGKMEALVKWLNELQQPEAFRAIKQISVKSGEPPEVIAEVEVARWYRPVQGGTPETP
jgi:type II secretory pathway component PulM